MGPLGIERVEALLLIAAMVAMLARRVRLPYTVGLVLAGVGLALSPFALAVPLTKQLIFSAFLPPLVFEAAFHLPAKELRRDGVLLLLLATVGVVISAAVTSAGMHVLAGWDWSSAWLFGVLIAATDPVSVIATLREAGAKGRFRLLAEAESLLNDGTAAVGFVLVLALVRGEAVGAPAAARMLAVTIGGGVLCGALVGGAAVALIGRATDHVVEITFTTVAAYGSFLLAEHFGFSGVLATLTAGLLVGNLGHLGATWARGREAVESFWDYLVFVVNSLVFLLIGSSVTQVRLGRVWEWAVAAIVVVLLARASSIYATCALFSRSSYRVERRHQHLLVWGGLRGALALALALGLPASVPYRAEITAVAFAVAVFSILVQGLTIVPLLRRLGELPSGPRAGKGGRSDR